MKEVTTYAQLRPALTRLFAVDRVENAVTPGMPDVMLSAKNRTIFIEMKAEVGKRLRGSQCAWCMKRAEKKCMGDMFVLTRHEELYVIFWMVDVVNNAGIVSMESHHVVCENPEEVAGFFYVWIHTEEQEVADDVGR